MTLRNTFSSRYQQIIPRHFSKDFSTLQNKNFRLSGLLIRGVHSVGSNVANSIRFVSLLDRIFSIRLAAKSNVKYSTSEAGPIECRIFDIRSAISRKSNIRHPMHVRSNVENPTSEARLSDVGFLTFDPPSIECQIFDIRSAPVGCRIFDIRSASLRISDF